jgi:hypothetical protein
MLTSNLKAALLIVVMASVLISILAFIWTLIF